MTCVIGTRRWLCADRRITSDDGEKCAPERKVWKGEGMIAAGAGDHAKLRKVRALVLSGATHPETLIDALGSDAHALVLLPDGKLFEVTDGAVYPIKRIRCIGTGGDLARGYVEGRPLTEATARAAQRLAARLRDDCGAGCDFESWKS